MENPAYSSERLTTGTQSKGATDAPRLSNRKNVHFLVLMALGLLAAMATGCGTGEAQRSASNSGNAASREDSVVTVLAAASLTDAFNAIAAEYRLLHPGSEVVLNFDGSQRLRTQLEHGARADVFASADRDQMEEVDALGLTASPPVNFASNRLVILGYTGSGGNLEAQTFESQTPSLPEFRGSLEPLTKPGTKIVLGQPEVPIGRYTEHLLENIEAVPTLGRELVDGLRANVVSREVNVRAILQKVTLGEADAGVVYSSDARVASDGVSGLHLPDSVNVTAHYPIAALTKAPGASRFVDFVLSEQGQQILRNYGFGPPLSVEETNP